MSSAVEWTRTPPSEHGHYWLRMSVLGYPPGDADVVFVTRKQGHPEWYARSAQIASSTMFRVDAPDIAGSLWLGPLQPPPKPAPQESPDDREK